MNTYLSNSLVLDGYRLIRFLGRGGFGEVWLCQSVSMGDYRALKFIPITHADRLEKEYDALLHYRKAAAQLRSPHLVPIEHVNRNDAGLYYVMPLADGAAAVDPADQAWSPVNLATTIHERTEIPVWFSSKEIIALIRPVLDALQTLSDAGLVHRDVKPENILFFNGQPCLADISLLGADASVITRRGTPGYATPTWYVGGHPDMYGVAATLYTLLTGNSPDKMGRAAFVWPAQGEASLSAEERAEWKRLHGVIRRATEEKTPERFLDFRAMAEALSGEQSPGKPAHKRSTPVALLLSLGLVVCVGGYWLFGRAGSDSRPEPLTPSVVTAPAVSGPVIASKPADSPQTSAVASRLSDDGNLAFGALTTTQTDPDDENYMTSDENSLYQDTMVKIQNCVWDENKLDFPTAIQLFDACMNSMPKVRKRPNVQLVRLLLQQCADGRTATPGAVADPSFLTLGNDDLSYRVALLCRLGAEARADEFLGNFVTNESRNAREKSEALVKRARVRATIGRHADARTDAEESVALAGSNLAIKTQRQNDLTRLAKDIPAYADYVKTHPGK